MRRCHMGRLVCFLFAGSASALQQETRESSSFVPVVLHSFLPVIPAEGSGASASLASLEGRGFALAKGSEKAAPPRLTSGAATPATVAVESASVPPHSEAVAGRIKEENEEELLASIERRFLARLRIYSSASFAGGLTVGVVLTLLLLSLGVGDRFSTLSAKSARLRKAVGRPAESSRAPQLQHPMEPEEEGQEASAPASSEPPSSLTSGEDDCGKPVESLHRFMPRCSFLVAMLLVQSLSSLMLAGFQDLIQSHPSIVFFLTMVVGTGGNVGGQSVVLAVRRLACGEEVSLSEQLVVGLQLAAVLAPLALFRAYMQGTKLAVCLTIGLATVLIVVIAALLGTALPKLLARVHVDPAHATPVIQVLMDMVGVLTTCVIGYLVLDIMLRVPVS